MIVSGPKEGAILAKEANGKIAFKQTLEADKVRENAYIIITNFDFWDNDFRAFFDGTAGHKGHPRRLVAIKHLEAQEALTEEILWETLNLDGVLAITSDSTIAQAVMNVEKGYFNVSGPVDLNVSVDLNDL
jgi:hypothetical protein